MLHQVVGIRLVFYVENHIHQFLCNQCHLMCDCVALWENSLPLQEIETINERALRIFYIGYTSTYVTVYIAIVKVKHGSDYVAQCACYFVINETLWTWNIYLILCSWFRPLKRLCRCFPDIAFGNKEVFSKGKYCRIIAVLSSEIHHKYSADCWLCLLFATLKPRFGVIWSLKIRQWTNEWRWCLSSIMEYAVFSYIIILFNFFTRLFWLQ